MTLASRIADLATAIATAINNVKALALAPAAFGPADYGAKGWTQDPQQDQAFGPVTVSRIYTTQARMAVTGTVSTVTMYVTAAGASLTAAYVAVYALDGTLLGVSANQNTAFQSTGVKAIALTAATSSISAGTRVIVALLAVGTTGPTIAGSASSTATNIGLVAASPFRQAFSTSTALTTMPSPMVHSGYQISGNGIMALLS